MADNYINRFDVNGTEYELHDDGAVRYNSAQSLTEAEKTTARDNIGSASQAALAQKPDALKRYTVVHVAKSGSDTTGDGSESKPYLTIQKAVGSLPKLLMVDSAIRIHAGSYDEDVNITGFSGSNPLQIIGNDGETVQIKSLEAWKNACPVFFTNLELIGTTPTWNGASLYIGITPMTEISNVRCVQTETSANMGAFRFDRTPIARVVSCTISNKPIALDVFASTVYLNNNCTGENNTVGIRCGSGWGSAGGFVQKGGATIAGEEQKGYGGQIW